MSGGSKNDGREDELVRLDRHLLERVDAAMAGARHRCGRHWRCREGRTECCVGVFPVHQLDGWRLRRGLEDLRRRDPDAAAAIEQRAERARRQLLRDFPGDPRSGVLGADEDALERACERHERLPCPALSPDSGRCELYASRPRVCRTFGPPLRLADGRDLDECPYCFSDLAPKELDALRVEPDPEDLEGDLLERLEWERGATGLTFIAFALAPREPAD